MNQSRFSTKDLKFRQARYRVSRLAFLIGLGFLSLLSSCQYKKAVVLPSKYSQTQKIRDQYVFMILMDGSRIEAVERAVHNGRLPTFKELFFDDGARIEHAITVVPTVSTPAHQAFLSGLQPGHHGIPALDWFSRPILFHPDYLSPKYVPITSALNFNTLQLYYGNVETDEPQLIFNTLRGYPTLSAYEASSYGVTYRLPDVAPFLTALRSNVGKMYENWGTDAVKNTLSKLNKLPPEKFPRFSMIDFYDMDLATHFEGPDSDRILDLSIQYDRFLRDLKRLLVERGLWEKSTIIAVSDHGQHALSGAVDLPKMLYDMGFAIPRNSLKNRQVIWGDHGTGTISLYFKVEKDWKRRPTYEELQDYPISKQRGRVNLFAEFLKQPDIEIVIVPEGPWKTHLYFKDSHAVIERRWQNNRFLYAYRPDNIDDPLNYTQNPTIKTWVETHAFIDEESWLRETHKMTRPDVIVGVPQIFDDYRAGDFIVMTYPDKQFKEDKPFGHGSLEATDRRVPIYFHGAGIKPGVYPYMRTIDMYPTLLALFGLSAYHPMDGVLRGELLQESYLKTLPPPAITKAGYTPKEFRDFLLEKQKDKNLNDIEKKKIQQVLFGVEAFIEEQQKYPMP